MPKHEVAAAVPTWIEDATRRMQAKLAGCDLPPVLGHADWEAQKMRWRNGEAHVVHDWDSLAWLPEAGIAGSAAGDLREPRQDNARAAHEPSRPTKANAAPASRLTRRTSPGRRASGKLSQDAREELIYNRPKLSYDQLKAQGVERLARADLA
jgi:hypothetical protein